MSNSTASTLCLIGGILNIIGAIAYFAVFGMLFMLVSWLPMGLMIAFMTGGIFLILGIIGLILGIFPLMWRSAPGAHKIGLIVLGILTLGTIGGLLFLIAGIIAEEEAA